MRLLPTSIVTVSLVVTASAQQPSHDLSDRGCRNEALISIVEDARIYASCVTVNGERIMRIAVSNFADARVGRLRSFSIGFCGESIIALDGPPDWVAKIEGDVRHYATWSLPDNLVEDVGVPARARVGGFVVRLKPGWKRSRSDSAWWGESHVVAQVTTHDC